jgi:hypothetical protein
MWNINGLHSKVLGDKSKNEDFINQIKTNDFIFLTETWFNTTQYVPGFKAISNVIPPKLNHSGRLSGGITFLFNTKFEAYDTVLKNSKHFLWCKISNQKMIFIYVEYTYHQKHQNILILKHLIN